MLSSIPTLTQSLSITDISNSINPKKSFILISSNLLTFNISNISDFLKLSNESSCKSNDIIFTGSLIFRYSSLYNEYKTFNIVRWSLYIIIGLSL